MKKIEVIFTVDGTCVPDGEERKLVIVGEPFVDPGLRPEFVMKEGSYVSIPFLQYKIDDKKSSKDKTSFIAHSWRPSTGDMLIYPTKRNYKVSVKVNKIAWFSFPFKERHVFYMAFFLLILISLG